MKHKSTMTTASDKISITTDDLISIYKSIENAEPHGRILKDIYCGDLRSFNVWLSKYVNFKNSALADSNKQHTFWGVAVSEKSFMPKNMALLIDQTGEQFAVITYDIINQEDRSFIPHSPSYPCHHGEDCSCGYKK